MERNKNIWVIPTDKPSRVYSIIGSYRLGLTSNDPFYTENFGSGTQNQNIYITNDEEIKEGDWVYYENGHLKGIHKVVNGQRPKTMILKKIILTTDQDLIKDGVQAIDDEFLEWFVKNPSCEFVKVNHFNNECKGECGICDNSCGNWYEIIIPQEEPKQETTLEEAAKKHCLINNIPTDQMIVKNDRSCEFETPVTMFIQGAKWQQERSYSEEDLKHAFFSGCQSERQFKPRIKCWEEWFEQFKKK